MALRSLLPVVSGYCLLALVSPASAQTRRPAGDFPVLRAGWVDLDRAITTCEEGKRRLAELQKFVDDRSAEFNRRQKELAASRSKLKLQPDKLSAEARSDLQEQITAMENRAQRFQSDSQAEIDRRKNRLIASMTRKLRPVIEKVGRAKGCNAVFYLSESLDARVSPGSAITDEVVAAYNAAHPTPAQNPGKRP